MSVEVAFSVRTQFQSKDEYLSHIEDLHRQGARFYNVQHELIALGLFYRSQYLADVKRSEFLGTFEEYVRIGVAECVATANNRCPLAYKNETLAKLFGTSLKGVPLTEEIVHAH